MTTQTRWFSLRRRLIVWLLGGVTVGWLAAMGFAYVEARHEIEDLLEHRDDHEDAHVRKELAEHFIQTLLTPLLFGLPLLGGWIWFATRRGLAPLDEVAAALGTRAPERLDPVVPAAAPREIRPLLEALNKLFDRVGHTLDNERKFTADAAHELRTPLMVANGYLQMLQKGIMTGDQLTAVEAGLSGTLGHVLTRTQDGATLQEALGEAIELGLAEGERAAQASRESQDPRGDVAREERLDQLLRARAVVAVRDPLGGPDQRVDPRRCLRLAHALGKGDCDLLEAEHRIARVGDEQLLLVA